MVKDVIELRAQKYLESLNLGSVVYEPDGNITPDFVIDNRIAVEVTRLNQNFESEFGVFGLENEAKSVLRLFENLLPKYGSPNGEDSWWVSYSFRRPLDLLGIKTELPKIFKRAQSIPIAESVKYQVVPNFELELRAVGNARKCLFTLAGYIDFDAGGWVVAEVIRNLNLRLPPKTRKIQSHRIRYTEWWLVFVDLVGGSLSLDERAEISSNVSSDGWEKIILLNPRNLEAFEL